MKNFDWTSFTLRILIRAPKQKIYNAFTRAGDLENWFLRKALHYDSRRQPVGDDVPAEKDFRYTWSYYLFDPVENGRYTEANGSDHVQFTYEGDCTVDVKLIEVQNYVQVELRMKHIPTDDISKLEIRLACHSSWSFYLVNLKSVYEGGLDLRNKDSYFRPMVNN